MKWPQEVVLSFFCPNSPRGRWALLTEKLVQNQEWMEDVTGSGACYVAGLLAFEVELVPLTDNNHHSQGDC